MGVDACITLTIGSKNDWLCEPELRSKSAQMCEAFGVNRFDISRADDRHALSFAGGSCHEQTIDVNVRERYYGNGYERGDWPFLYALMRWLRANIHGCRVWYGGDERGIVVDDDDLEIVMQYFLFNGHANYLRKESARGSSVWCDFCLVNMTLSGGGRGEAFFVCRSCGEKRSVLEQFHWQTVLTELECDGRDEHAGEVGYE